MNKVGVCGVAFKDKTIEEIAGLVSEAGADGIEVWGQPPHIDLTDTSSRCGNIREITNQHDLQIPAFGSYYKPGSRNVIDGVAVTPEAQLEIAASLGAPLIRIWAGEKNYEHASPDERSEIIAEIAGFADMAAGQDIGVVIERHGKSLTNSWDSPASVLQTAARDNLFLNYQVPHPQPPEELIQRAIDDYRIYLPVSAHAHIQNYRIDPDTGKLGRCFLDQGVVDYSELGSASRDTDYEGWFMVEFLPDDLEGLTEAEALKRDIDFIRGCLE